MINNEARFGELKIAIEQRHRFAAAECGEREERHDRHHSSDHEPNKPGRAKAAQAVDDAVHADPQAMGQLLRGGDTLACGEAMKEPRSAAILPMM